MKTTIHFHGSISLEDIEKALHQAGIHLRPNPNGTGIIAERVPRFLTHAANVVEMPQRQPKTSRKPT